MYIVYEISFGYIQHLTAKVEVEVEVEVEVADTMRMKILLVLNGL